MVLKLLKSGDEVISTNDLYGGSYRLFTKVFENFGIKFRFTGMSNPDSVKKLINSRTKIIWVETPTNPMMNIIDIKSLSKIAKDKKILLAVEDKGFFDHHGISLKSISRAFYKNVKAVNIEGGGSTITQQLAKNLFFTSEQTIKRKLVEAVAALLIEFHYSKQEILLAYINEVYLTQSGTRSIHGFGLGAQHFFGSSLKNLDTHQLSLLVGMLKGPSVYNPRRNPKNALSRRNTVLGVLRRDGLINEQNYKSCS